MAPVRVWTSREGSAAETAFISIAQGMLIVGFSLRSRMICLTTLLSEQAPAA
jgi:hypothetical protein